LKSVFSDIEIEYVEGSGGIFDVFLENELLFSRHHSYRFPEPDEIVAAIQKSSK